ncbi:citrate/2-methylcitrate synthase [Caulobacter sp. KR2-114]|uniref:citrate/2-methylcitrate synthase n=1 Tax=Caulobacter sp. KR2-114 TaxID=3400912 RepID=UPI003C09AE87
MPDDDYLSAPAAAALLGVSLNTFYVYVGRHGIRSQPVAGSRERLYWRQDLLRLRTRRAARQDRAAEAGAARPPRGELRRESALTLITEQGPFYRGQSALELAEAGATLEDVAGILWDADAARVFATPAPDAPPQLAAMSALLQGLPWPDRAALALPLLELANPRAFDLTAPGMARTGGAVIRWLAAILTGDSAPAAGPVHRHVADRLGLGAANADLLRRLLVLSADHGFEPAAYAVRAVAANGVTPWRAVMTGLLVSVGRRSSLSRHEAAGRLLTEALDGPDATAPLLRCLRDGEVIPGFEPGVYGPADPRAEALLSALAAVAADERDYRRFLALIEAVREARSQGPSLLIVNQFLGRRLGLGPARWLFPLARAVGWIAHAIEQTAQGEAEHREGLYLGPLPKVSSRMRSMPA